MNSVMKKKKLVKAGTIRNIKILGKNDIMPSKELEIKDDNSSSSSLRDKMFSKTLDF